MLSAGTASVSSRKPLCGVFGHVLFPQMFSVGRVIADPGQGRLRQLLHRTKKIGLYFTRSHRPSLTRTSDVVDVNFCTRTTIANGSKCNTSGGNTRRLLGEERPRRDPAVR